MHCNIRIAKILKLIPATDPRPPFGRVHKCHILFIQDSLAEQTVLQEYNLVRVFELGVVEFGTAVDGHRTGKASVLRADVFDF